MKKFLSIVVLLAAIVMLSGQKRASTASATNAVDLLITGGAVVTTVSIGVAVAGVPSSNAPSYLAAVIPAGGEAACAEMKAAGVSLQATDAILGA